MRPAVYLDLSPEMQQLPGSLRDLLRGQGVEIPPAIKLSEGPTPSADEDVWDKDWGYRHPYRLGPAD